jgi:hypothetical protein
MMRQSNLLHRLTIFLFVGCERDYLERQRALAKQLDYRFSMVPYKSREARAAGLRSWEPRCGRGGHQSTSGLIAFG